MIHDTNIYVYDMYMISVMIHDIYSQHPMKAFGAILSGFQSFRWCTYLFNYL